ncbi:hypothetical protein ACFQ8E_17335 [Isoptericola sp. NPDC056573]|uniref:hypothetical protein n=1 Tax=Isoptericola sp. NPDC056573 TaxID=3345868 RepID=UPI0036B1799A
MTRHVTLTDALAVVDRNARLVRDLDLLDPVCQRPRARMDSANRLHPLHDGNERLSLILVHVHYAMNGRRSGRMLP